MSTAAELCSPLGMVIQAEEGPSSRTLLHYPLGEDEPYPLPNKESHGRGRRHLSFCSSHRPRPGGVKHRSSSRVRPSALARAAMIRHLMSTANFPDLNRKSSAGPESPESWDAEDANAEYSVIHDMGRITPAKLDCLTAAGRTDSPGVEADRHSRLRPLILSPCYSSQLCGIGHRHPLARTT